MEEKNYKRKNRSVSPETAKKSVTVSNLTTQPTLAERHLQGANGLSQYKRGFNIIGSKYPPRSLRKQTSRTSYFKKRGCLTASSSCIV